MKKLYVLFALLLIPALQVISQVSTDFEDGTFFDGWTVEGDSDWYLEGGTGNPDTCLRVNDDATGAMNRAYAPVKFLGDWSSATNNDTLRADIFLHQVSGGYVSSNFVFRISGPGCQASGITSPTPVSDVWTSYKISLNPADWNMISGTWIDLVNEVTELMVTVEYINGDEYNRLDNISLSFTPTRDPITAPVCSDFQSGGYDGWAFQGQGSVSNISSGGNPGRFLRISNNSSATAYAFAPTKFLGDWSLVENVADICFDLLITDYTGSWLLSNSFLRISGPGGVARIPMSGTVLGAFDQWYSFAIPIQSASWIVESGTWAGLINHVNELRLCLEFTEGEETVGLDDFCITNLPPVAEFSGFPEQVHVGYPVQFTDLSDGFATSWGWDFGDTGSSSEKHPDHTYTQPGTYTVTLTAYNNYGSDPEQKTDYIQVDWLQPVVCSDFEGGGLESWTFQGNGGVSNISTGGSPGRYLRIYNGSSTAYGFAPTKFLGDWSLVENVADVCFDLLLTGYTGSTLLNDSFLRISGPGGVARVPMTANVENAYDQWYSFTFPIQAASWTMVSGTWGALVDQVTELRICLEFTDGSETVWLDDFCISNLPPVTDFTGVSAHTFVGDQVQFTDLTDKFATSWSWDFGDTGTSSEKNPGHTYNQAGTYTVTLTAYNNYGNNMEQKTDYIQIDPIDECNMFSDDFSLPTIHPAWILINGSWDISSGTMRQYSNYYGTVLDGCYAITGSPLWSDYFITSDIQSTDNDRMGLVFNYQDAQNMYMFLWYLESSPPERALYKWENGVATVLDSDITPYVQSTWYTVKAGSDNGTVTVSIDGQEIFNVQDNTFTSGKAGFYCWANSYTYWDNLMIECPTGVNLDIQNVTVSNGQTQCYDATEVITVGGGGSTFVVENGGSATLIAGQKISFLPGSDVYSGGYMHGYISPSGPWCNPGSSLPPAVESGMEPEPEDRFAMGNNFSGERYFKIYPNPTTGTFTLELIGIDPEQLIHWEIYSMRGGKILTGHLTGENKHELSLSDQPAGIYFIRIIAGDLVETRKIIRQ